MASQSTIYKIATIVQTISIAIGVSLMVATVILEKLDLYQPSAVNGLLVGICFFLVAASSAIKTFSQN